MATKQIKCSLVGDRTVGKMCLARGEFPKKSSTVGIETREMEVTVGSDQVTMTLFVVGALAGNERFRHLTYPGTDVFMACFSLMRRGSVASIRSEWIPEIRSFSQTVPILLVGTKMDLRMDEEEVQRLWDRRQEKPISTEEGRQLAQEVGAKGYMECSAKTGENLKRTMEEAARLALEARGDVGQINRKCILQ